MACLSQAFASISCARKYRIIIAFFASLIFHSCWRFPWITFKMNRSLSCFSKPNNRNISCYCNSNGNNAYFIKKEYIGNIKSLTPEEDYVESQFRESRDHQGNLSFVSGSERHTLIAGKEVYNTRTGKLEQV